MDRLGMAGGSAVSGSDSTRHKDSDAVGSLDSHAATAKTQVVDVDSNTPSWLLR